MVGVAFSALVVPIIAVTTTVPLRVVTQNLVFLYLSVYSCVGPALLIAYFSYDFASILGMYSEFPVRFGFGLSALDLNHRCLDSEFRLHSVYVCLSASVGVARLWHGRDADVELNLVFLYLSVYACVGPALLISPTSRTISPPFWVCLSLGLVSILDMSFALGLASSILFVPSFGYCVSPSWLRVDVD